MNLQLGYFFTKFGGDFRFYRPLTSHRLHPIDLGNDWLWIFINLVLSVIFLIISANYANLKILSFPANPLRWHLFIITNGKDSTDYDYLKSNSSNTYPIFIVFWAISMIFLICASLIAVNIFTE